MDVAPPTAELETTATEVGLEVKLLEVAAGAAAFELTVVGVYMVEKLDTVDEVTAAAVAHLGCHGAFPQPKKALAAALYGFCPFFAAAAALGKPCTTEYDVLRDTTPVEEITSTTRDCRRTSMTAPGRL